MAIDFLCDDVRFDVRVNCSGRVTDSMSRFHLP
jgi:hypothetical protein